VVALLRLGGLGGFGHGPHLGATGPKVTPLGGAIPIPSRLPKAPLLRAGRGMFTRSHGPRKNRRLLARTRDAPCRDHAP
jgi:hypothetical protein